MSKKKNFYRSVDYLSRTNYSWFTCESKFSIIAYLIYVSFGFVVLASIAELIAINYYNFTLFQYTPSLNRIIFVISFFSIGVVIVFALIERKLFKKWKKKKLQRIEEARNLLLKDIENANKELKKLKEDN